MRRVAIEVHGVVQGVGFRPFVHAAARRRGLAGWVCNRPDGVAIEVQGSPAAIGDFLQALRCDSPPAARIERIESREVPLTGDPEFVIGPSHGTTALEPSLPADLALCDACAAEIVALGARRRAYPFTNCAHCGPRFSIIEAMPYDRAQTSMRRFDMCRACAAEYADPSDRRFHAQPIACPTCGPSLRLLAPDGSETAPRSAVLEAAVEVIQTGKVLALKGVGGFHLLVDAADVDAVALLRVRKGREEKPFAVMFPSLDAARDCCEVSPEEIAVLTSPEAPIVLLRRRGGADVASNVAPGNPRLGVLLPYSPLHALLLAAVGRPVVCTSGNRSEEPICIEEVEALARLGGIADAFLVHDRPIVRPMDDSVVQMNDGGVQILRRSRGYVPTSIRFGREDGSSVRGEPPGGSGEAENPRGHLVRGPVSQRRSNVAPALVAGQDPSEVRRELSHRGVEATAVVAVGGHLKNTIAVAFGGRIVSSQHLGDLDSPEAVALQERAVDDFVRFFDLRPSVVACDLHPDYASTRLAERLAAKWGADIERVQHHHAHIAACAAEHRVPGPLLGLAWDGAGLGADGTLWGGEGLRFDRDTCRRLAHMRSFPLPGGEAAMREPRRAAFGVLHAMGELPANHLRGSFRDAEIEVMSSMLGARLHCPLTTSIGRLFDAVAALVGLRQRTSFEGQAAMELEWAAVEAAQSMGAGGQGSGVPGTPGTGGRGSRRATQGPHDSGLNGSRALPPGRPAEPYPMPLSAGEPAIADWEPCVRGVLEDRRRGVAPEEIAARFHAALAELALAIAERVGLATVALGGGCFQNLLLTRLVSTRLRARGFEVLVPRQVPSNDGGLAVGQAAVALWRRGGNEGLCPRETTPSLAAEGC